MTSELNDMASSRNSGSLQPPAAAAMAPPEEFQDSESSTRQDSAAVSDDNHKTADARAEPAGDNEVGRREATHDRPGLVRPALVRGPPLRTQFNAAMAWLQGPVPPSTWKIRPFLPHIQRLPLVLVDKFLPKQWQRLVALFIFYVCWIVTFGAVLHVSSVVDDVDGYGSPALLGCGSTFWYDCPMMLLLPHMYTHSNQTGPKITHAAWMVFLASLLRTAHSPSAVPQAVLARKSSTLATSARKRSSTRLWWSVAHPTIPFLVMTLTSCIVGTHSYAQLQSTLGSSRTKKAAVVWSPSSARRATIPA